MNLFCYFSPPAPPPILGEGPGVRARPLVLHDEGQIDVPAGRQLVRAQVGMGAPLLVVKAQGNWNDVATMQRYTQDIQPEDFEPYSPVASLMGFADKPDE